MPYQALYRKYRSQTFDDIVGQEAITKTLKNAIIQNKISHAYLFNGPRGTGKTSCAKIFAKAINCPNQHDGEPCNKCEICKAITEGTMNDVIEIDAASNNGVEEIREIRDKAKYAPTVVKYKVYIIDEVHMLSKGAFNALLKTLEEPPKNVIFILATTEPHKIPATIISRTQRFDFKRIPDVKIVQHLANILDDLNVEYDDSALKVIAQIAEGGMRDALSILDQVIAFSENNKVTLEDTLNITGSLTSEMMFNYLKSCFKDDIAGALDEVNKILAEGKEVSRFLEDLISYLRDLLLYIVAKVKPNNDKMIAEFDELQNLVTRDSINNAISILFKTQESIKASSGQVVYLEVMTVELVKNLQSKPKEEVTVDNKEVALLKEKVQFLENEIAKLSQNSTQVRNNNDNNEIKEFVINYAGVNEILMAAKREYLVEIKEVWPDVLNILNEYQRALVQPTHTKPVAASENGLVLSSKVDVFVKRIINDKTLLKELEQAIWKITNRNVKIEFVLDREWLNIRQDFLNRRNQKKQEDLAKAETVKEEKKDEEVVTKAKELFGENIQILDD